MITKKFISCIYLYHEHCVVNFKDRTIHDTDPVRLARYYGEHDVDELIVFDLSETDEEHEAHIDILKEICSHVGIDVICGGNVKKMEDIKKYLYAGCKAAILDMDTPSNREICKEVSLKFGKEKLVASYNEVASLENHVDFIEEYTDRLLLMNPHMIRETAACTKLPFIVHINQVALNKLMEIFAYDNICGITGNTINDNVKEIPSLKELCKENGILVSCLEAELGWEDLKKNSDGMVPVVVQDYKTNEVLMVAYMNEEAYLATLRTGKMTYFSRSRQELWLKGATSGHFQYVKSLTADCDRDTILAKVHQIGSACHTGNYSCFFENIVSRNGADSSNPLKVFEEVFDVIKDRKENPKEGSYTNYLFDKGIDKILKKLGEEATEIVIAAKNPNENEIKYEIADFLYHMMVLMAQKEITWEEITTELANR